MSPRKGKEIQFKSWQSYWKFERTVKQRTRYVYDSETTEFLSVVLFTSRKRVRTIREGSFLLRAQIGHDSVPVIEHGEHVLDEPSPYPAKRMKPKREYAKEGRVNPRGIPHLYLSFGKDVNEAQITAMAEVRPWAGALISVAQFKVTRNLKIVDCTSVGSAGLSLLYLDEPNPAERETAVWQHIDQAFAKPVDPTDSHIDYVPTQILAELFRENGFDGIGYRSSLGPGFNIALFDLDSAKPSKCFLYEVKSVDYQIEKALTPYQFRKYTAEDSS